MLGRSPTAERPGSAAGAMAGNKNAAAASRGIGLPIHRSHAAVEPREIRLERRRPVARAESRGSPPLVQPLDTFVREWIKESHGTRPEPLVWADSYQRSLRGARARAVRP